MLEMKLTITAPDLSAAINNLAQAISTRALGSQNGTTICAEVTNTASAGADTAPTVNPTQTTSVPTSAVPVTPAPTQDTVESVPVAPIEQPVPVPTAAPAYTLEMIATAGTALIDAGKMEPLTDLIARYGISSITELDPSQYGAFATELRALGAQI